MSAPTKKRKQVESEPVVLSHAERRRQRKKEKQDQVPHKKRKLVVSADDSKIPTDDPRRQPRQHSVWVGNLSFRTTPDTLRAFFDGVGTITRIHMPMRRGSDNIGFAYIDFDTAASKVSAIALSEGHLDGRRLLIKDGDDFTGRPVIAETPSKDADKGKNKNKAAQRILRAQKQPPAPSLFLGNLGFDTTEESIRELFEAHRYRGSKSKEEEEEQETDEDVWIRKIRVGTFEDSGACKGFAFVDFTSIEHATAALVNPRNHRLNGRDLVVEYASPDAVRRGGGPRHAKGDRGSVKKDAARNTPYTKQRRVEQVEQEDVETTTRSRRPGHVRSYTRRSKPGAALAHAQRQSAAIMPGQGQKIVF